MPRSFPKDLEYKVLYAVIVAGKSARFAEAKMIVLFEELERRGLWKGTWFESLPQRMPTLVSCLKAARVGNYDKNSAAFHGLLRAQLDLATCTVAELEAIKGIKQKTSRFFMRWSNRRDRYAVLDVHILAWLAEQGHNVPKITPQSKREYERVTQLFLAEADRLEIHPVDLDEKLWLARNKSGIRE